jgi:DNA repair protein RecO
MEETEAIVLKSLPFQERDRILTLFSKESGLFSLIVKKISNPHLLALTTPFSLGEFLYKKGRGELFLFQDGTLIDSHSFLRKDLDSCMSASFMAKALLDFHFPQSHSAKLYSLFLSYLNQIPFFERKENLSFSFFMKILLFEGLLHLSSSCNVCKEKKPLYLFRGESLCSQHQEKGSFVFSENEWKILEILTYSRSFQFLKEIVLEETLKTKISKMFQELN